jgi:hypothetical protein
VALTVRVCADFVHTLLHHRLRRLRFGRWPMRSSRRPPFGQRLMCDCMRAVQLHTCLGSRADAVVWAQHTHLGSSHGRSMASYSSDSPFGTQQVGGCYRAPLSIDCGRVSECSLTCMNARLSVFHHARFCMYVGVQSCMIQGEDILVKCSFSSVRFSRLFCCWQGAATDINIADVECVGHAHTQSQPHCNVCVASGPDRVCPQLSAWPEQQPRRHDVRQLATYVLRPAGGTPVRCDSLWNVLRS